MAVEAPHRYQNLCLAPRNYLSSLNALIISVKLLLALPKTIMVLGRTKSSFSILANPGFMLRLRTMTVRANSASNTGMP